MANKKIENSTLFGKNVVKPTTEEFRELLEVVGLTIEAFKELLAQSLKQAKAKPFDGYANLKDIQKGIEGVDKATEGLTKAEAEQIKLEKKLADLKTQQAKDNEVIKQQIVATRKELRETAKVRAGLLTTYQQESKRLRDLKNDYKNAVLEQGEMSDTAQKLLKDVLELDKKLVDLDASVNDNFRSVGSYKKQLAQLENQLNSVQGSVRKANNALRAIGIIAVLDLLKTSFAGSEKGAVAFQKVITSVTVTVSLFVTRLTALFEKTDNIFDLFKNGKEVFKGFTEEVEETIKKNLELVDANEKLRKSQDIALRNLANQRKEYERLRILAEDATTPLLSQIENAQKASELFEKIAKAEVELARQRSENARLALENDTTSLARQQEYTEAYVAFIDKQIEVNQELADVDRTFREALRDELEQELDFILDVSDRRKTVAEKTLSDETIATNKRVKAITDAENDINQSFDSVIAKTLEYQKKLNDSGKSNVDLIKLETQLRTLSGLETTEAINKQAKAIELDEIVKKRVLELVLELTTAERDFKDAKIETKDILEKDKKLNNEIKLQLDDLQELRKEGVVLAEFEEQQAERNLQAKIDRLREEVKAIEDDATKKLELQKQLNDALIDQEKQAIAKKEKLKEDEKEEELKKEAEKQARLQELRQLGVDSIRDIAQKNLEATTNAIDREISALEAREDRLRELADKGVENVENNLALEQKRRAELEQKRAEAVRRQQRVELGLSVLETYSNKVSNNDPNALTSTITDTSLLLSFINSLPAFYEGTEDTGKVPNAIDSKGGRLSILHDNERVLNARQNAMIPDGMSNLELATIAKMSDKAVMPSRGIDNPQILNELRELRNAIEAKPVYDFRYDDVKKAVVDVVESRGRIERSFRKNDGFF